MIKDAKEFMSFYILPHHQMICAIVHPFQANIFNNNFTVHPIINLYESLINHDVDKTLFKEMQIIYVANFGCKKQAIIAY